MPIYMDIHDTTGATADDIAVAHQLDMNIQEDFRCKFLYFWHDVPNKTGFCVFEAPDKKYVINLHNKAHNTVLRNQIIEVELDEMEFFLGKIADIAWTKKNSAFDGYINETVHRTIMYLEIENPMSITLEGEKGKFENILNLEKKLIKNSFLMFEGQIISWENNSILSTFLSQENAINCAEDIGNKFMELSKKENLKSSVSIGLHYGAPVTTSHDLFGDIIKLAKQLEYFAGENRAIISSALAQTYKELTLKAGTSNRILKVLTARDELFLMNLYTAFENHWNNEEFNIYSLVKQFGLSRAQLYRKITTLTGCSPNKFIRKIRLKNARKLIDVRKGILS